MAGGSSILVPVLSLQYESVVSTVISSTIIETPLTGFGDAYFQGWYVNPVLVPSPVSGAAPQGDYIPIGSYVSQSGRLTLTRTPSGAALIVGDRVKIMHPSLVGSINLVTQPSANIKQQSLDELSTASGVFVPLSAPLSYTGAQGGCRVSFQIKSNNAAGTAYAVVYRNGIPVVTNSAETPNYTIWSNASNVYITITQDIPGISLGDVIQIYGRVAAPGTLVYLQNFTIGYDIIALNSVQQLIDKVYFDSLNGYAGTTPEIGTAEKPVNNVADLITILTNKNLKTVQLVNGIIGLTSDLSGMAFYGNGWLDPLALFEDNAIELNGYTLTNCAFHHISVHNTLGGNLVACGPFSGSWTWADTATGCIDFFSDVRMQTMTLCSYFHDSPVYVLNMINCSNFYSCLIGTNQMTGCFNFINCEWLGNPVLMGCYIFTGGGFTEAPTLMACVDFTGGISFIEDTVFDFTGVTGMSIINAIGARITINNITDPSVIVNISGSIEVEISNLCTAGAVNINRDARLINNTGGTLVNDRTNNPKDEIAININAILAGETNIALLNEVNTRYTVDKIRIKCDDPGPGNDVLVRLYELINGILTEVQNFEIGTGGSPNPFTNYYSLADMFGLQHLAGNNLRITVQQEIGGGPTAVTGSLRYKTA